MGNDQLDMGFLDPQELKSRTVQLLQTNFNKTTTDVVIDSNDVISVTMEMEDPLYNDKTMIELCRIRPVEKMEKIVGYQIYNTKESIYRNNLEAACSSANDMVYDEATFEICLKGYICMNRNYIVLK